MSQSPEGKPSMSSGLVMPISVLVAIMACGLVGNIAWKEFKANPLEGVIIFLGGWIVISVLTGLTFSSVINKTPSD